MSCAQHTATSNANGFFSDAGVLKIHLHFKLFNNFVSYPVFRLILATTFSLDYYILGYMLLCIPIGLNPCFEL